MDRLQTMSVFVAVAEEAGFAPAARRLNLSPPSVTRAVSALEARLGARLLHRTTRSVRLTDAGQRYLIDCRRILADIEEADRHAAGIHAAPRGMVSVSASALFGRMIDKENIPAPSPARGRPLVRPTLQMALKALVYQAMRDGGVRKVDLRRRLDWSPAQVERLLSPRHASRLAQFDAAAEALGIVIDVTTSQGPRRQARSPARAAAE